MQETVARSRKASEFPPREILPGIFPISLIAARSIQTTGPHTEPDWQRLPLSDPVFAKIVPESCVQDEVNNLEINSHFDLRLQATLAIPTLHTGRDNARLKVRRDFFHGVRDRPSGHRCRVDVGDVLAKGLAGRIGIAGL